MISLLGGWAFLQVGVFGPFTIKGGEGMAANVANALNSWDRQGLHGSSGTVRTQNVDRHTSQGGKDRGKSCHTS